MIYAGIGSRETPPEVMEFMTKCAEQWAQQGWFLRSGGARGADTAFEKGCDAGGGQKKIYRPEDATPESMKHAEQFHPKWYYLPPYAKRLQARNSLIILGDCLNDPVDLVVCWTPNGFKLGGTAQGLRIAEYHKIPVANLGSPGYGFNNERRAG